MADAVKSVAKWIMPKVYIGQTVLWRQDVGDMKQAEPAVVTLIGTGSISLSIIPCGSRAFVPKSAVRHYSDPQLKNVIAHDGVWDYTEGDKQLQKILD